MNAIDLEVIYQSTLQIARELTLNMLRTGYSTIIKESQDFTFAIFDGAGRMVAQGIPQPLHIGPLAAQVNEIRRRFRDATEPGDAFIVNHPYQACQNHATDVTVISPIFVGERLVGFIGNIAHKPDLGGKVPGTNSGDATDLFQEGLLIPPLKILRRGEINSDVEALICANTRTPEVTWGDIKAQVNTNTYGLSKFAELFGKYGADNVLACWQRWMDICESRAAQGNRQSAGRPLRPGDRFSRRRRRRSRKAPSHLGVAPKSRATCCISFSTATRRRADPINLRPCVSRNFIECLVKMIFIPALPVNDGLSRPVRVSYPPEGSLLNPRFPAPVNMYVRPSQVTTSVIMRVLAQAVPGRVPAPGSAAGGSLSSAGRHPQSGRWYSQYEILNGGTGARPDGDGVSAMDELVVNVMNTPVEAIETEFPVRVERYELAADSGGPGTFRGGLGVRRQWRILADEIDRQPAHGPLQVLLARHFRRQARARLEGRTEPGRCRRSARSPPKSRACACKRGDLLSVEFAGGGGWGDPHRARSRSACARMSRAVMSRATPRAKTTASRSTADLAIDADATARLRARRPRDEIARRHRRRRDLHRCHRLRRGSAASSSPSANMPPIRRSPPR